MSKRFTKGMDDQHWDYLFESIEDESCIICIGPEVYAGSERRYEQDLAVFLKQKEEETKIRVYEDGWFHYLPGANEIDAWQLVKDFYRQPLAANVRERLQLIAQLPIHLMLHFVPGYQLNKAFEDQNLAYQFLSYQQRIPFDTKLDINNYPPSKQNPLVFNMLGEIKKRNSLVMTYDDFYTYLESVFKDESISPVLKENIWEADYFIFLGMPFDKWYVHMFMRILQQHRRNITKKTSKKYAANIFLEEQITTHSAEQYTMTFVPNGIHDFLQTFYDKAKEREKLRTSQQAAILELPFEQLEDWVRKNKFENIFDLLIVQLGKMGPVGDKWKTEVVQIEGRFNDLQRNIRIGVLEERDRVVEMNRIRANILSAIKAMKKQFTPS